MLFFICCQRLFFSRHRCVTHLCFCTGIKKSINFVVSLAQGLAGFCYHLRLAIHLNNFKVTLQFPIGHFLYKLVPFPFTGFNEVVNKRFSK
jgi:hypothetical protein